jgi:hypothetical protein
MRALGRKGSDDAGAGRGGSQVDTAPPDIGAHEAAPLELDAAWEDGDAAPAPSHRQSGRLAAVCALGLAVAWTGFFIWALPGELTAAQMPPPREWAGLVGQWAMPVVLIAAIWLIAMRSSQAEAHRFAASAAMLSHESAELEARLKIVNRELSLAREFLAAQSRELESLGRIASERISAHAAELQTLIASNGAQLEAIGSTSETALGNMNGLRDDLPVIANAARDVANQIGGAGRIAEDQLERLAAGFDRLGQFGTASETQVAGLADRVGETLAGFEAQLARIEALANERFAALQGEADNYRDRIEELESEALAALDQRADRIAERDLALSEALEQRQAAFDTHETQASEVLAQRLAALDEALAQRREAQIADTAQLITHSEKMTAQLGELGALVIAIGRESEAARTSLAAGLGELGARLADKNVALNETSVRLADLTESGIRLLEIIQSGARHAREDLASAIASTGTAVGAVESRVEKIDQLMLRSAQQGSDLSDYLIKTRGEIDAAEVAIAGLRARLADHSEDALARLQGLRGGFARLAADSGTLAAETQEHLRAALATLEDAISQAFATLDSGTREQAGALARSIGTEAVEVLERALRTEAAATIGKLEQSAAHAAGMGREAVIQLRDQLVRVNELTGNLEQRVTRARELAEEQVNNDFARRMALITDSLNSAAIDISGALSAEIADGAWDAYLKGDRGIFTRRAVRLIDAGTARDITALYAGDEAFRANVSRYIHDFEAMLRAMLSTRDGHVLSVTMLGSDMGKLYVVLAQAIQRLRN